MVKGAMPLVWRRIPERYYLRGSRCENCGGEYFPQRQFCPKCRRKGKIVEKNMPETGKILTFTRVHVAPKGFEHEVPYFMAIIELGNGVKILSQVVDSDPAGVAIGAPVKMVFRKVMEDDCEGAIAYGYKFKVTG
ncbi:MAG: Zn-ribbon domain-containing OB-fold protein [Candidatus Micrarchaeota archaeon]